MADHGFRQLRVSLAHQQLFESGNCYWVAELSQCFSNCSANFYRVIFERHH